MKKLLSFLLVFSIFVPTIWAYDLTDKDKVIVLRASTAIEKMITRKWENYRAKYVTALQKLQLRFQNNPRMQKIIGETANVLSDDTSGLESVFTTVDTSVNSSVDTTKKEPVSEVVTPVKNETQNVAVVNQVTVRKCYMENGEWQETYSNNTWWSCGIVSCNNWYEKLNNKCLAKCSSWTHREWESCISNTRSCISSGWGWVESWNGGSWSTCNISDDHDVTFKWSTTYSSSQTVSPGASDIVLMDGTITSKFPVILENITVNYTTSNPGTSNMYDVYLQMGTDNIRATPVDISGTTGILTFIGKVTIKGVVNVRMYTKLKNSADGYIQVNSLDINNFSARKYVDNQNAVSSNGSIAGRYINIISNQLTVQNNLWSNTSITIKSGTKGVVVYEAKFSMQQGNSINLSNLTINTIGDANYAGGNASLTLYVDWSPRSTKNIQTTSVNFEGLNKVVSNYSSVTIFIKADFSDDISWTFWIESISYDAIDSTTWENIFKKPSISGPLFTIVPTK